MISATGVYDKCNWCVGCAWWMWGARVSVSSVRVGVCDALVGVSDVW